MESIVILPSDPSIFEHSMVKFKFVTDNYSVSFVIEGKPSREKIEDALDDLPKQEVDKMIDRVSDYFAEAQIGETEFSEIASVLKIKRLLSGED